MLTLPIKKKWFDMIFSGEKKEEYREIKPYYETRFMYDILIVYALKIFPPMRPFMISKSWPVVGFSPHVGSTGVFSIASKHT